MVVGRPVRAADARLRGHRRRDRVDEHLAVAPGSAFALGLLWGVIGGLIGAATKLPLDELTARAPATVRTVVVATVATLRPLAAVLVTCTAIGLVGWLVQVGADAGGVRTDRSAATALIEEAAFAGRARRPPDGAGGRARFTADANGPLGLPFPVAGGQRRAGPRRRLPHLQLRRRDAGLRAAAGARAADGAGRARRAVRRLRRRPRGRGAHARDRRRVGRDHRAGVGDRRWRSSSSSPVACSTATPTMHRCSAYS